jgi:AcrR family transcriptional regulator
MTKAERTKLRIIEGAIEIYNRDGFTNVKVRDLAKYLDMSPGNITYYFPNNKDMLNAIYNYILKHIKASSMENHFLVHQGKGVEPIKIYLEVVSRFRFFYKDIISILKAYPEIAQKHQKIVNRQIEIIESLFFISVGKEYLRREEIPGMYRALAEAITHTLHFWLNQQTLKGKTDDDFEGALAHIDKLIYPYYTKKGLKIYFPDLLKNKEVES